MTVSAALIPLWMTGLLGLIMVASCGVALRFANWRALIDVPARQHLLLGATLVCLGLWSLSIRVDETLSIHLLGMTSVTLVLGWCFAILAGSFSLLALLLLSGESLTALPLAWLLTVAVPATVSRLLVKRLNRIPRQNLFMFTLGGGFAGGILSVIAVALTATVALWLLGVTGLVSQALEGWPLITLVMFPEGFINGMLVTALCVFYPEAVKTFDHRFYFDGE